MNMRAYHTVEHVRILDDILFLEVDGKLLQRRLSDLSPRLMHASDAEKACFEVSPSGYGIHWPLVDEDISVDALLGIVHRPEQWKQTA